MIWRLSIPPIALFMTFFLALPAQATDEDNDETVVTNGPTTFDTQNTQNEEPVNEPGTSTDPQATSVSDPVPSGPQPIVKYVALCLHGDATLEGSAFGCPSGEQLGCGDGGLLFTIYVTLPGKPTQISTECIEPGDPQPEGAPPVDIPGEVLKAFRKVELPASTISIQPPGGETLVNFKTILPTPAAQHQVTVHLDKVDIDVVLELTPSHFLWKHGDGSEQSSTIPGTAWTSGADVDSAGFITHVYTKKLTDAKVSVDTTWSARFMGPNDKDWRNVDGTVTKVGAPVSLAVLEATPQLVTDPS